MVLVRFPVITVHITNLIGAAVDNNYDALEQYWENLRSVQATWLSLLSESDPNFEGITPSSPAEIESPP